MPAEHEDELDYRSAALPILRAMESELAALRILLAPEGDERPGGEESGEEPVGRASGPVARDQLTPREREVLGLLVKGAPNSAIAHGLGISVRTVKAHLGSIFNKLDVGGRTEAIVRVLSEVEDAQHGPDDLDGPRAAVEG